MKSVESDMADGDVVLDRRFDVDPIEGTEVVLLAIESSAHPGGYSYGFQYFQPEEQTKFSGTTTRRSPNTARGITIATPITTPRLPRSSLPAFTTMSLDS